jgi:hypothetical protein
MASLSWRSIHEVLSNHRIDGPPNVFGAGDSNEKPHPVPRTSEIQQSRAPC